MADEYILKADALKAFTFHTAYTAHEIERTINRLHAAEVAPVVCGEWVDGHCDKCGCYGAPTFDGDNEKTAFCPNCGARMDARKEPTNEPQA